jgi:hypothetical protein
LSHRIAESFNPALVCKVIAYIRPTSSASNATRLDSAAGFTASLDSLVPH